MIFQFKISISKNDLYRVICNDMRLKCCSLSRRNAQIALAYDHSFRARIRNWGRVAKFRGPVVSLSPLKISWQRNVPAVFDRKRGMYCRKSIAREARIYEGGACGGETGT